jgi:type I restriction enzyme, S subunit
MKQYQKYKPSGIDWIGEIPSHWMVRRVSTFGKFFKGRGIKKDETKDVGLPCIRYGEIYTKYDRIVYETASFIDIETSKNSELIKKGDVLFAGSGETVEDIGKAVVYFGNSDTYAGGDIIVLRLQDAIEPIYASYLMNSSFVQHQKSISAKGEIIVHIYPKNIREIITPLPPKEEQTTIAIFLDEKTAQIDTLITNKQKLIELLKEERTSIINEAVSGEGKNWEKKKLKYVAKLRSGEGITAENIRPEGEYPVYGGNGLRGYTSAYTHEGDYVLIGRQGALCGNINYASGQFFATEHAVVVSILDGSEFVWLGELLRSMNLNQYSQASAQPGLSVEKIQNLTIPVPSLKEQTVIVHRIQIETQCIDNTISKIEREIELMNEYRTALISEVVTGKIKVAS